MYMEEDKNWKSYLGNSFEREISDIIAERYRFHRLIPKACQVLEETLNLEPQDTRELAIRLKAAEIVVREMNAIVPKTRIDDMDKLIPVECEINAVEAPRREELKSLTRAVLDEVREADDGGPQVLSLCKSSDITE